MNYLNLTSVQIGIIALCLIIEIGMIIVHRKLNSDLVVLKSSGKIPDIIKTNSRKKAAVFMIITIPILLVALIKTF